MNYCPCCSEVLLQHVRGSEITWFCRHCWQDMPVLSCQRPSVLEEVIREEIPSNPERTENLPVTSYVSTYKKITGWIGVKDALS
ncbi:hypothetical protein ACX27_16110 [Nostoc piscinale CENA21]|uniref:Uncharacterized protein n=1 Tax=Nostoc piscinale CENA21 TaxID=224013 RepID=A0A0M4TVK3_9NOSO|nr:hypothetical protein [Nostoc piscinale]ALF54019.1 hypothetical protein ACX27_16110 [Nostoc piscinale CENA21]